MVQWSTKLRVECYAGYKADQRPIKFWLDDALHFVDSIGDQWYGPEASYFRVHADDGNTYLLAHNTKTDQWTLETFRSGTKPLYCL
jgi:hypothetical protein